MTTPQRVIAATALLTVALCTTFPPWKRSIQRPGMSRVEHPVQSWRYSIFTPPPAPPLESFFANDLRDDRDIYGISLDLQRLAAQWAMVSALACAALLLVRRSQNVPSPPDDASSNPSLQRTPPG